MPVDDFRNGPVGGHGRSHAREASLSRRRFATGSLAAATLSLAVRQDPALAQTAAGVAESATDSTADQAALPRANQAPVPGVQGPLADYVASVDPATRVESLASGEVAGGRWRTVRLVSQRWRGVEWTHELTVYLPANTRPDTTTMLVWINGGSAEKLPTADSGPSGAVKPLSDAADAAGLPAVAIRQVPYQPMFGGLVEDGLIAHSFAEYVRTGDVTWPLLLPMVKAAVTGMDAAAEIARTDWKLDIESFVVTGASKRGWTTWLTAAVDPRVAGIVPMVIDMLSMDRHLRLQTESFGGPSGKLSDYTKLGIEKLLGTPRGRELIGIVDPYSYRASLQTPKLITLGTNDPYWPLESLELYRGGLPGPCWVSYCPNAGHGIPLPRVAGLVAAMGQHAAGGAPLPTMRWRFERGADGGVCRLRSDAPPQELVRWQAESATRDFRKAQWTPTTVVGSGPEWEVSLPAAAGRWTASLIELRYVRELTPPLMLTTAVNVCERRG